MPQTEVIFYQETDGTVPLVDWLDGLEKKLRRKCVAKLELLEQYGHELRRPAVDTLRDGIRELRVAYRGVQYRMLYFPEGKDFVVVTHGIQKEDEVPPIEIDRAIEKRRLYRENPSKHTFPKKDYDEKEGVSVQGDSTRL